MGTSSAAGGIREQRQHADEQGRLRLQCAPNECHDEDAGQPVGRVEEVPSRMMPHNAAIVARWRTLRCNICRRPLQRALLMPGSVTLATCRRDRATFVFTVAESGALLVMRRG